MGRSRVIEPSARIDSSDHRPSRHFPAIDGLRAVAVVIVVLNHAGVPGFERGFVGVDMFFAISGFLITDRIVRSLTTGESQPLMRFWAGRARRILPAMACVTVVTCGLSAWILGPQELSRIAAYGFAADVFVVNNLIGYRGGNYFAGPLRDLPFLHLWSLAVEEQFYVIWPLVLGPVARFASTITKVSFRRTVSVGMGVAVVASLATSVVLTDRSPIWAFYGLPTRFYEFALGGAAVLFWVSDSRSDTVRTIMSGAGLAALVAGMVLTPIGTGFPSAWPLLSAGGTVLVVLGTVPRPGRVGRSTRDRLELLLGSRPMRVVGRYSYGWYLWHWPAFVLGVAAWNSTWARVACVASIVPAVAMFHLVEQPVRFRPALVRSNARSLAVGALFLGVGGAACLALALFARVRLADPHIADLSRAEESFPMAGCSKDTTLFAVEVCLGGSVESADPIVLLVGDSHAGQWAAAFSQAGRDHGFRVAARVEGNCSSFAFLIDNDRQDEACRTFQAGTEQLYASPEVSAVVFGETLTSRKDHGVDGTPADWYEAAVATIKRLQQPAGLIVDNPQTGEPLQCLSRGNPESECRVRRAQAFEPLDEFDPFERRLSTKLHVDLFDVGAQVCSTDPCPLKYQDTWIAARANHLNRDFTLLQEQRIADFIAGLLTGETVR